MPMPHREVHPPPTLNSPCRSAHTWARMRARRLHVHASEALKTRKAARWNLFEQLRCELQLVSIVCDNVSYRGLQTLRGGE